MNQRLPYEEVVSSKLQSLPLPDLADAIWARVERQLDIDLPTDDGGGNPAPPAGPSTGTVGWGLSVFIVALVSLFFLFKKDQHRVQPTTVINAQKVSSPQDTNTNRIEENTRSTKQEPSPLQRISAPSTETGDSSVNIPITSIVPDLADSAQTKPATLVVAPPVQDSGKKKRGVSGLSDGDYRIVPKKDN